MKTKLIENGLYLMKDGCGWCRHGLVKIVQNNAGKQFAVDTYWNDWSSNGTYWPVEEVQDRLEFIINLDECHTTTRREWEQYADSDKTYIPAGGRSEKFLVRKSAKPVLTKQVEQLEGEIRSLRSTIEHSIHQIARKEQEISELSAVRP